MFRYLVPSAVKALIVAVPCVVFVLPSSSVYAQWVKTTGPDSVRVLAAGAWPTMYAGTRSGVFLSVDNGGNWTAINNGLTHLGIRSLIPRPGMLFVGTEGGGVFRSTNNGTSWAPANNGLTSLDVRVLKFYDGKLFAGTANGLFRSTDSGASWSSIGIGATNSAVTALEFYLGALYAGTEGSGVFVTSNEGVSWSAVNPGLTNLNIHALVFDASFLYAATGDGVYALRMNSFPDPGWKPEDLGTINSPNVRALVTPGAATDVYVYKLAGTQGSGVFLSNPTGPIWTPINEGLTDHDVHAVEIWSEYLFAGTDGGIWRRPLSEVMDYTSIRPSPGSPIQLDFSKQGAFASFTLPASSRVILEAFTPDGRRAAVLLAEDLPSGPHTRRLNTETLPNGLYFYRLRAGDVVETRKVLVER